MSKDKFIRKIAQECELAEDGYLVWFPSENHKGYLDSRHLRWIAEYLEEENKEWNERFIMGLSELED